MTRWARKKPLWPILGALGCLFILAILSPRSWRRDRRVPATAYVADVVRSKEKRPEKQQTVITLQPELQAGHSVSSVPTLSIPPTPPIEQAATPPEVSESVEAGPLLVVASQTLPEAPKYSLDVLLQVRDAVWALVEQLPKTDVNAPSPPATPSVTHPVASSVTINPPRQATPTKSPVQVSSESDRLALLITRKSLPQIRQEETVADLGRLTFSAANSLEPRQLFGGRIPQALSPEEFLEQFRQSISVSETTDQTVLQPQTPAPVTRPPATGAKPLLRRRPTLLIEHLETLSEGVSSESWAQEVLRQLLPLTEGGAISQSQASSNLVELERLASTGNDQALEIPNSPVQVEWLRTAYMLKRRLGLWKALLVSDSIKVDSFQPDALDLPAVLGEMAAILNEEELGEQWRTYLLLDQIAAATSEGGVTDKQRGALAYKVLMRMSDTRLTPAQRDFLATAPFEKLRRSLQVWASQGIDLERLAALVERYETRRETRYGVAIAQLQERLRWSEQPHLQELAAHLDRYYRSANMRVALTDDFLNRLMPPESSSVTSVHERIAGSKVRGRSRTTTRVHVRLLPAEMSWKIGLDATGKVYSNTRSETWPAWVHNAAKMQYQAEKVIVIDTEGMHVSPAQAQAHGRNELLGVDSQFDAVPLVGPLLRDIARHKNHKARPKAISQVKAKVAQQVKHRMDSEADPKLEKLERRFQDHVISPIGRLALVAKPVDMHTTTERAIMRLRLANNGQLAAHTPRPTAPSDSLVSLQVHETVMNNALAGLQLEGRRMKVVELFDYIAQKLGHAKTTPPEDLPRRAVIQFAARDAVQLSYDDDRLKLVLNLRELSHRRDKIRNFQVHVFFRPVLDGLKVQLVRDGTPQFSGRRLTTGPRVVLHSVFGNLFPKDREIQLLPKSFRDDPRLEGLMITQLVIDDGWIAWALGPARAERTAWRSPAQTFSSQPLFR